MLDSASAASDTATADRPPIERRRRLTQAAKPAIGNGPPAERLRRLAEFLSREGILAESQTPAEGPRLTMFTCPYAVLTPQQKDLCEMEREAFSELVNSPVEHHRCVLDGDAVCEFQVSAQDAQPAKAGTQD